MKRVKLLAIEAWLPIVLVTVWLVASAGSGSLYFPPLADILHEVRELWIFDATRDDLLPSLGRIGVGFCIAVVVGVVGGVLLGLLRPLEEALRPLLEFLRATPGVALLPIATLFLGIGDEMKIFLIALASVWPILLNTIDGVRSAEPVLLQMARSYRFSTAGKIRFIYIPNAAPGVFAGCRLALAIATVVMVVTEMVGSPGGIGWFILDSQRSFNIVQMWSGIVVLGLVGYALNLALRLVESRVLAWHHMKNG
ncbi:ABC transporter permease [Nocardioides sp. Iso805N]|uniref:ABC transporter permease n=1 Tax=Nocardioides sp. Iso805N TaxID=1283287 RepID=UPI0004782FDF|nr:ABC transporter permease [Nocardioides sp. Iso805N]